MKRILIFFNSLVAVSLLTFTVVHAVPNLISYQGVLNDSGGTPVNATVSMTFKIYDVVSGGTALWSETQSVQVINGVFNVQLGSVQSLTSSVFQTDTLYLGVQVAADPEMTPRQRITTGSYSHKAALVEQVIVPIGSIMAWAKSLPGVPTLPEGWVECNGQTLEDPGSPLDGQVIPALNGTTDADKLFLRGSTTSGGTGGSFQHSHAWSGPYASWYFAHTPSDGGHTDTRNHLPPYYEVVWIMRIK